MPLMMPAAMRAQFDGLFEEAVTAGMQKFKLFTSAPEVLKHLRKQGSGILTGTRMEPVPNGSISGTMVEMIRTFT